MDFAKLVDGLPEGKAVEVPLSEWTFFLKSIPKPVSTSTATRLNDLILGAQRAAGVAAVHVCVDHVRELLACMPTVPVAFKPPAISD